jgi:hypothetical protein
MTEGVMNVKMKAVVAIMVFGCISASVHADQFVQNDTVSQAGGTSEASPTVSSTQLNYKVCSSTNPDSDQQALLKINIIGNGPNQVPAGSTITDATLRLKAQVGGDGLLYRAGEAWNNLPTWQVVGDVLTAGGFIGIGMNTNEGVEWPVTSHVQLWANGTSNQGWVIKGSSDDCQAARIYNGSAGANDKPRLTVIFIPPVPPDTTPPKITDLDIGSTVSPHPDYDVPAESGVQIKTVSVAQANQVFVTFSENVTNVSATMVSLATKAGIAIPASVSYASNVATLQLTTPITAPMKVVLTVASGEGDGDVDDPDRTIWVNNFGVDQSTW